MSANEQIIFIAAYITGEVVGNKYPGSRSEMATTS